MLAVPHSPDDAYVLLYSSDVQTLRRSHFSDASDIQRRVEEAAFVLFQIVPGPRLQDKQKSVFRVLTVHYYYYYYYLPS
jgi:hypothetical protein